MNDPESYRRFRLPDFVKIDTRNALLSQSYGTIRKMSPCVTGDSALWKHPIDITFCYGRLSPMETSDRYHLLLREIEPYGNIR